MGCGLTQSGIPPLQIRFKLQRKFKPVPEEVKQIQRDQDRVPDYKSLEQWLKKYQLFTSPSKALTEEEWEQDFSGECQQDRRLMKLQCSNRLPVIKALQIRHANLIDSDVLWEFLTQAVPDKLQTFVFNFEGNPKEIIQNLKLVLSNTTNNVYFSRMTLTKAQFVFLFESCIHVNSLTFKECTFKDFDESLAIDLTLKATLQQVTFLKCFRTNSLALKWVISAISMTVLQTSKFKIILDEEDILSDEKKAELNECHKKQKYLWASDVFMQYFLDTGFMQTDNFENSCLFRGGWDWANNCKHGFSHKKEKYLDEFAIYDQGKFYGYQFTESHRFNYDCYSQIYGMEGKYHGLVKNENDIFLYENGIKIKKFSNDEAKKVQKGDDFWLQLLKPDSQISLLCYPQLVNKVHPIQAQALQAENNMRLEICAHFGRKGAILGVFDPEMVSKKGKMYLFKKYKKEDCDTYKIETPAGSETSFLLSSTKFTKEDVKEGKDMVRALLDEYEMTSTILKVTSAEMEINKRIIKEDQGILLYNLWCTV
ncbi:unnamed protein product [Moneuplotes crassus]|uniref:Uncharacterized protein n=1 Tax=Euplotes crassus TaxID=5936 RepID=A0AAD1X9F7_EUPCR|nr:unnamed protein product [Moneuplotes crassus]